jgi:hypothetical protein
MCYPYVVIFTYVYIDNIQLSDYLIRMIQYIQLINTVMIKNDDYNDSNNNNNSSSSNNNSNNNNNNNKKKINVLIINNNGE